MAVTHFKVHFNIFSLETMESQEKSAITVGMR
jgi:hypothetical protein